MADNFRTFDLSELDDRELHAYQLGLCAILRPLEVENHQAFHDLDEIVMAESLNPELFRAAQGRVDGIRSTLKSGREENLAILQEKAKRQGEKKMEENKDG